MQKRTVGCFRRIMGRLGLVLIAPFILLAIIAIAIDAGRTDDPY